MAQSPAFKTGAFSRDATRWTTDWLVKERGYLRDNIDGARPDELGPLGRCLTPGEKNGQIEADEAFAVVIDPGNFGKFVARIQGSRLNPLTKLDKGFDLSWLQLSGANFDVEKVKKAEWTDRLLGGVDQEGSLAHLTRALMTRASRLKLDEPTSATLVDRALRTTEFGLLPMKDQLDVIDRYLQTADLPQDENDAVRSAMRRVVVGHGRRFTGNEILSRYVQLRGRELQAKGEARKAAELYDLSAKIDPGNRTAAAELAVLRHDEAGLQAAYDAGIRDDGVLEALAEARAARNDFRGAVTIALERRGHYLPPNATPDQIAWDLKIFEWARKDGDLLLIDNLLRTRSGGIQHIKDPGRREFMKLVADPQPWIEAAEIAHRKGDYEAAIACLDKGAHAVRYKIGVSSAGGLKEDFRPEAEQDKATLKRIGEIRGQVAQGRQALPQSVENRHEILTLLSETKPVGNDFAATDAELKWLEEAHQTLGELDQVPASIHHMRASDVDSLVSAARWRIASGVLHGDRAMYEDGLNRFHELQRYAALEEKKETVFNKALSLYYANSRYIFKWDISGPQDEILDYEAKRSAVGELAVIRTIRRLEAEKPELAEFGKRMLQNLRGTALKDGLHLDDYVSRLVLYDPVKDGPMTDGFLDEPYNLKETNDGLEALYGDDERVAAFFAEVDKTREQEALKDNKDYQKRLDVEGGLNALPSYVVFLKTFEIARTKGGEKISKESLEASRGFLLERAESLKTYAAGLQERIDEISVGSEDGAMRDHYNSEMIGFLDEDVQWLEGLKIPADDDPDRAAKLAAVFGRLETLSVHLVAIEEYRIRSLLEEGIASADEIPAMDGNPQADLAPIREEVLGIPILDPRFTDSEEAASRRATIAAIEGHTLAFRTAAQKIDDASFARAIDARMMSLKSSGKSISTAATVGYYWSLGPLWDDDGIDLDPTTELRGQWKTVKDLWASGDPAKRAEAKRLYQGLVNVSYNDEIEDDAKWARITNTLISVEAVVLAGMTAGAASEFVAPFAEAAFSEWTAAQVVTFTNAFVFTGSLHVYEGFLHDGFSGAWNGLKGFVGHPLSSAEEVILTFGMFKFMGLADSLFERTLGKYLGETGNVIGKFMAEGSAFQIWDFIQTNYMMLRHGHWDPLAAAKQAFNVTSLDSGFGHGFLFLIALKAGGALSAPLARPMNDVARNLAYKTLGVDAMERDLKMGVEQNLKALDEYFTKGKGSLDDLLNRQEDLLLKQKEYLEKLPEEVRNNDLLDLNGKMLANVRQFRDAYRASVLEQVKKGGANNPYGVKVLKGGLLQYSGAKGVAFVSALKKDPSVQSVRIAPNGLVVVDIVDPLGRKARVRVVPMGVDQADLRAMRAVVNPGKQSEAGSPQMAPVSAH